MEYAAAARWLLYVNAYDDTSAKPKEKGLPSPGVGWPGKLGLIAAVGDNLFQTLMLNLTFLKDGRSLWEGEDRPVWEREPSKKERQEIAVPDNLAELLTLQSRRLAFLMILRSEHYSKMALELHQRERSIKAARGMILDTKGKVIADNRTVL